MATITAGDFRNGVTFEMDGQVMQVVEFQHVKPGKGAAFVRTKMKNVLSGGVTETSFNPTAKFETAFIERKDDLPSSFDFVKEETICKLMFYKEKVVGVEAPNFVELEVTQTDPGFKGNTATNVTKPAIVETGAEIKVPLFINPGDRIKIDTRNGGEYLERCKG